MPGEVKVLTYSRPSLDTVELLAFEILLERTEPHTYASLAAVMKEQMWSQSKGRQTEAWEKQTGPRG